MLPKINRLTKKKDFEAVFKKGKSVKNGFLVFKILNNSLLKNRFGFIVSKKVSNKAVVRNKIKRQLSSIVFANLKNLKNNYDVVVVVYPQVTRKEFKDIESATLKLMDTI